MTDSRTIVYNPRMETPEQQLDQFRAQIDALDEQIVQLMLKRCGIVRQVGALKNAHWPAECHIRPAREGQMHRAIAARFRDTDIPPAIAITIWRQLIGASTQLESPLSIAYGADFDAHYWLAREYFGQQVGLHAAQNLDKMLELVKQKTCNIMLLPADLSASCWAQSEKIHSSGLRIFAQLPAVAGTLPPGLQPALALAKLECEPSGDDISYFFTDGRITRTDGFVTSRSGAIFLGAHPRTVSL